LLDPRRLWRTLPSALASTPRPARVERVELKAVTTGPLKTTLAALGPTDTAKHQTRGVYYLDTPDLDLHRRGLVARVRLTGQDRADAVVKLRSPAPDVLPAPHGGPVELDALPAAVIWTSSVKRRLCPRATRTALDRRRPARHLFSAAQRALLAAAAGPEFDIDDLLVLGPVDVVRVTSPLPRGRIAVETWRFPDGSRIVELSAKCRPARLRQTVDELRARIAEAGIPLPDRQATKTQTALERLLATVSETERES
jgi:hypothetical protein